MWGLGPEMSSKMVVVVLRPSLNKAHQLESTSLKKVVRSEVKLLEAPPKSASQ